MSVEKEALTKEVERLEREVQAANDRTTMQMAQVRIMPGRSGAFLLISSPCRSLHCFGTKLPCKATASIKEINF